MPQAACRACRCKTLKQALDKHHAVEVLDGDNKYRCPLNNRLVRAHRSVSIQEPPNVLIIHLKRFEFASFGKKVARHIQFPLELDIARYLHDSAPRGNNTCASHLSAPCAPHLSALRACPRALAPRAHARAAAARTCASQRAAAVRTCRQCALNAPLCADTT
jgi:hypothetical protein